MADYKDQQSTDPAKAGEPSSNESEALRQEGMDGAYGSSCCTPGKKAFHPWESDTWECETDETCDTSDATSASSLNSESLETTQPEPMDRTFAARPDAAQDTALWQDLVRSQQPTDGAHDEGAATLGETVANPAMQWTLVDLGTASCDTPGCDPAKCDAEDCQEDGLATSYQEMPDYATAGVTGPGPAPEPMVGRGEPGVSSPEANPAAEPKKRGRGKKAATDSAVFPEQAAAPAAKPKRGAAKKGAKKPAAKKAAKKGAKKPATKAKKGAAKKGAKKPATPRGKKAAATPGANGQAATDAPMPTEKAA